MEQKLFTELRPLYVTSKENPNEIRIRIRMRDLIDPAILRRAVDTTKPPACCDHQFTSWCGAQFRSIQFPHDRVLLAG